MQLVGTLAEQLEGRLAIESEGGTTFRVAFPSGVERPPVALAVAG
jgi:two-component sensor histidine kinase